MELFLDIAKQAGPWVAFVALFVWQTVVREKRMADRLDSVQDEFRKCQRDVILRAAETNVKLISVVEQNTVAVDRNTMFLQRYDTKRERENA